MHFCRNFYLLTCSGVCMLNLFLNLFSIFTSFPGTPFSHLFPINLFCPKHLQSLFSKCNEILQRRDMPYVFFIIYRKIFWTSSFDHKTTIASNSQGLASPLHLVLQQGKNSCPGAALIRHVNYSFNSNSSQMPHMLSQQKTHLPFRTTQTFCRKSTWKSYRNITEHKLP